MLYISYQGVYDGTNYENANTPNQIGKAFNSGYSCMVDVWRVNNKLYLGSDEPVTEVTENYIQGKRFWLNVRNVAMQEWIVAQPAKLYPNYFWFSNDTESNNAVSSGGQTIAPGTTAPEYNTVVFLPEVKDKGLLSAVHLRCYGVCSTNLNFIKRIRNEGVWY